MPADFRLPAPHGCLLALLACSLAAAPARGGLPSRPGDRAAVLGQPVALVVQPPAITLVGPRALQQIVVTGRYADGSVRDLTPFCDKTFAGELAAVDASGLVTPRRSGTSVLTIRAATQSVEVPVVVRDFERPAPVSFQHEVIAALNVGGCNQGACHGTPSGKNGFKLSLRGFNPAADYLQLTRDVLGRRTDRLDPGAALVVQKALGRVPHEGGQRFLPRSVPDQLLRGWLAQGMPADPPGLSALRATEIQPAGRVLQSPARWQQLSVQAHFGDGSVRDVTRLTVFSSSDPGVAEVSPTGLVEFKQPGEVAILCRYLLELRTVRLTYLEPRPGLAWNSPPENSYVDHHVFAKLKMLGIVPSELCSDAEFLRRASLDLCGSLPTPERVRAFVASKDPGKRAALVDELLERPEYGDFWALKWSDVLRSTRKTMHLKGVHAFQHWIRDHVARNTPFDAVARELLTASGNTFRNPPASYYRVARDPTSLAETTAQLFFGIRMQCARCHNHPFERWTQDDYYSLAAFFAQVGRKKDPFEPGPAPDQPGGEIIFNQRAGEVQQPRSGQTMKPRYMGGSEAEVPPGKDRRQVFADWLTRPDNPFFARATVNRIWYHLLGRGIVDPVDDFRDSNPSANDELLDALAKDFVAHGHDVKYLIRVITTSRTYQLSGRPNDTNRDDSKYFSHAAARLLTAEQLLDALCTVTEVPEKFPGLPLGTRAIQLPDGDTSHPFLRTFGQPARELPCECERESDSNLAQALQLINGPTVHDKLRHPNNRLSRLLAQKLSDTQVLEELYLATLSRLPTPEDVQAALEHLGRAADRRKGWEDLHWALLNTREFRFRP